MDYKEFYRVAEEIIKKLTDKEIKYRTAISRLYYHVFHHIRENNWNNKYGIRFSGSSLDHGKVSDLLKKVDPSLMQLFISLRRRRNEVDYDLRKTIDKTSYLNHLKEVDYFIEKSNEVGLGEKR